ncbi:MAG: efflux RND transporter permease subunit [Pseudomonadota bacterium]
MKLTESCIRKPVLAWMLMAATVVFGGVAVSRIGISQFPDVDFPNITVSVSWEAAAPESVEYEIVEPLEEAVVQVEGVRSISSAARQGSASITVELDLSRDVDLAMQDVQTAVSRAQRHLPRDIDPPVVAKSNPEDNPIMWIGLTGPFSQQVLADTVRYRLQEKLQAVPGVGEVILGGYLERNVRIWIDADRLAARALAVTDVVAALHREHVELPAGQLTTAGREINVRVLGEALDLETLRKIVVREREDAPIYLADVALVEDGFEDIRRLARANGAPVQGVGIRKQRGANAVAVARGVRGVLERINQTLPEGMKVRVSFDSTSFIEESVAEIELELLVAVILTSLVCWFFLGSLSSTLNVLLAIPMSLLGTIAVIYFAGFTLNTFTLLALSLAVGIVVDDAIMVMENIFRHAEGGKDRTAAAREGTAEITSAALAATMAVIAIFLPVVFMEGVIGKFFLQFGIALSVAVALSYLEAVTLAPARCSQFLNVSREDRGRVGRLADAIAAALARGYHALLERGVRHPWLVLAIAAGVFALAIVVGRRLPGEFVPSQDQSLLMVRFQAQVSASLEETDRLLERAEAVLADRPEIANTMAMIGGFGGSGVSSGVMFITLVPPEERKSTQNEFAALLRRQLNAIPGLRAVIQDTSQSGFTSQRGFPMELSIRGPDWETLVATTDDISARLAQSGLVVDLDTDYRLGMPELQVFPDRARAADIGVSVDDIATAVSSLVGGVRVGKYSSAGRRFDVRLRLLASQRTRPEDIESLLVRSQAGDLVPLASLVKLVEKPALQSITRRDRERAITLFGNIAEGHAQDEVLAFVDGIRAAMPAGYHLVLGGASVAYRESMGGLLFALVLGIIVAYMVLAAQLNSFLNPVTVLTILPLSVAGAAFALSVTGQSLNIFSMIGILLLMGIVKKNSIILVDYATKLRSEGLDAKEAILRAGPVRLRPILMTSFSTMMAAAPASLALGPGGEIRRPMAIAVIGGIVVSTALSLLVVPAFYLIADRIKSRLMRLMRLSRRVR